MVVVVRNRMDGVVSTSINSTPIYSLHTTITTMKVHRLYILSELVVKLNPATRLSLFNTSVRGILNSLRVERNRREAITWVVW
jgi:hypothetical protein